eukprot:gene7849-16061_t
MERLVDYFAVVGLSSSFERELSHISRRDRSRDIVDISIVYLPDEQIPAEYEVLIKSSSGGNANIDHRKYSLFGTHDSQPKGIYIIYRRRLRNENSPAISNIGLISNKEINALPQGFNEVVTRTHTGRDANFGTKKNPLYFVLKREFSNDSKYGLCEEAVIQDLKILVDPQYSKNEKEMPLRSRSKGINLLDISPNKSIGGGGRLALAYELVSSPTICDIPLPSAVLDVCPEREHPDFPLSVSYCPMFTFPEGLRLKRAKLQDAPLAKHFSYVMTNEIGTKVYVSNMLFYEPLPVEKESVLLDLVADVEAMQRLQEDMEQIEGKKKKRERDKEKKTTTASSHTHIESGSGSGSGSGSELEEEDVDVDDDDDDGDIAYRDGGNSNGNDDDNVRTHDEDEDEDSLSPSLSLSAMSTATTSVLLPRPLLPPYSSSTPHTQSQSQSQSQDNIDSNTDSKRDDIHSEDSRSQMSNLRNCRQSESRHMASSSSSLPPWSSSSAVITWVPKCIFLVSHWPFLSVYRAWLAQLYTLSVSASDLPLERWISFFVQRCPVPTHGGPVIAFKFHAHMTRIELKLPKLMGLPLFDLSFVPLFRCLSVQSFCIILTVLLLEGKLVLSSRRPVIITEVCEALRTLLFPFRWEGGYVPRLAEAMVDCLEAPGALILGVEDLTPWPGSKTDSLNVRIEGSSDCLLTRILTRLPGDVTYVDLDAHSVQLPDDLETASLIRKGLPAPAVASLETALTDLLKESDTTMEDLTILLSSLGNGIGIGNESLVNMPSPDRVPGTTTSTATAGCLSSHLENGRVREVVLNFMSELLEGYESYLVQPGGNWRNDSSIWFDFDGFIAQSKVTARSFLKELLRTQLFSSFIQRRTQSSDPRLVFFDYFMHASRNGKKSSKDVYSESDLWRHWMMRHNEVKTATPVDETIITSRPSSPPRLAMTGSRSRSMPNLNRRDARSTSTSMSTDNDHHHGVHSIDHSAGGGIGIDGSLLSLNTNLLTASTKLPDVIHKLSNTPIVTDKEIVLAGPDRTGISQSSVYSYIQDGMLSWPKLKPPLFLSNATSSSTSTTAVLSSQQHSSASSCSTRTSTSSGSGLVAETKYGDVSHPLVDILVRDEYQLVTDLNQRKLDLESDHPTPPSITPSMSTSTSISTSFFAGHINRRLYSRSVSAPIVTPAPILSPPSPLPPGNGDVSGTSLPSSLRKSSPDNSVCGAGSGGSNDNDNSGHGTTVSAVSSSASHSASWLSTQAKAFARDAFGAWFLCLPSLVENSLLKQRTMTIAVSALMKMAFHNGIHPAGCRLNVVRHRSGKGTTSS